MTCQKSIFPTLSRGHLSHSALLSAAPGLMMDLPGLLQEGKRHMAGVGGHLQGLRQLVLTWCCTPTCLLLQR